MKADSDRSRSSSSSASAPETDQPVVNSVWALQSWFSEKGVSKSEEPVPTLTSRLLRSSAHKGSIAMRASISNNDSNNTAELGKT